MNWAPSQPQLCPGRLSADGNQARDLEISESRFGLVAREIHSIGRAFLGVNKDGRNRGRNGGIAAEGSSYAAIDHLDEEAARGLRQEGREAVRDEEVSDNDPQRPEHDCSEG